MTKQERKTSRSFKWDKISFSRFIANFLPRIFLVFFLFPSMFAMSQERAIGDNLLNQLAASSNEIPNGSIIAPQFWGLDLLETFPDWKNQIVVLEEMYLAPKKAFIAYVAVGPGNGTAGRKWSVDLLRRTRTEINTPIEPFENYERLPSSFDGSFNATRLEELPDDNAVVEAVQSVSRPDQHIVLAKRKSGGSAEPCLDPIGYFFSLQKKTSDAQGSSFKSTKDIIIEMKSDHGCFLGGYCEGPGGTKFKKISACVVSVGDKLFFSPDHTVFVLAGGSRSQPAIVLRLDEDLNLHFQTYKLKTMTVESYQDQLTQKGIFEAQKNLLLEFH